MILILFKNTISIDWNRVEIEIMKQNIVVYVKLMGITFLMPHKCIVFSLLKEILDVTKILYK